MKRNISVFIASPNDLSDERGLFRDAISDLNTGFGDGANVEFQALGWEDTLASTGRRAQGVINQEIDKCDVFILAMHRRWGQDAPDAKPYSSYTEEEFHRALERHKKEGSPEIFVFFKRVDPESEADAGPQLKKVMAFRRQLEESKKVLYHYFDDDKSFTKKVNDHLRAYAKGDLPKTDAQEGAIILPASALEAVERANRVAKEKIEEAEKAHNATKVARLKIEAMQLEAAEEAANLSKEGKVEFARQKFAKLVIESENLRILSLISEFYSRTGDLDSAFLVIEKWLNLSGEEERSTETAAALTNLGNLYWTRAELTRAEEMQKKSLAINETLGFKEGMASDYCNLGNLYSIRGKLDLAEEMYNKSLAISEALGRKEGVASQYGNLGILYSTRGELDRAEEVLNKSLAINETLDCKEGVAGNYGSLGNLYSTRGELIRAEKMYNKSLALSEALGYKEGMANQYSNLGVLYCGRAEVERAEEMYNKSLAINEALDRKEGMASNYGNLGCLYRTRGELNRAEEMYNKSLAINEALDCKEGMVG